MKEVSLFKGFLSPLFFLFFFLKLKKKEVISKRVKEGYYMKKITQLFVTFAFAFTAMLGVSAVIDTASASSSGQVVHAGTSLIDKNTDADAANTGEAAKVMKSIYSAANIFAGFVLGISIIMIIVGGLRYILSNGDQRQAEQGKMILIYSGIGIVIALSAFVIAKIFAGLQFG
ncbi:hypothetical protein C1N87_29450 (plasmid) [Priestia aryabhattai]